MSFKRILSLVHDFDFSVSFEEYFSKFMASRCRFLCLTTDQAWDVPDFQNLIRKLSELQVVFIGSESDIYTSSESLKAANVVVIDYSRVFRSDALNFLFDSLNDSSLKVVGIVSERKYQSVAESFQSRWTCQFEKWCSFSSGEDTGVPILEDQSLSGMQFITIHEKFNVEMYLEKIDLTRSTPICLQGAQFDYPTIRYLCAYLKEKKKDVFFLRYPLPEVVCQWNERVSSLDMTFIGEANFDDVNGHYFLESGKLKLSMLPKRICVLDTLSEAQWRYIGYLVSEHDMTVFVMKGVYVPESINILNETIFNETFNRVLSSLDQLFIHQDPTWLMDTKGVGGKSVFSFVKSSLTHLTYHCVVVQPQDRLADFCVRFRHIKNAFVYEEMSLYQVFQDANAVIVFENLECNPVFSLELAVLCLKKTFLGKGCLVDILAKVICLSSLYPKLPVDAFVSCVDFPDYLSGDRRDVSTVMIQENVEGVWNKKNSLERCLTFSKNPILLLGRSGSGKSYFLNRMVASFFHSSFYLWGSSFLTGEDVMKTVLNWLQSEMPSVLIVDHYDDALRGAWSFLIPNEANQIFLKGVPYTVPCFHQCIFVGQSYENQFSKEILSQFSVIHFSDYQYSDFLDIFKNRSDLISLQSWFSECLYFCQHRLEIKMSAMRCQMLCHLYDYFYQKNQDENIAKVSALYFFLLSEFSDEVLGKMVDLLSVPSDIWSGFMQDVLSQKERCQTMTEDQHRLTSLVNVYLKIYHYECDIGGVQKPILWIEGSAGSGKDYAVTHVLSLLSVVPVRVKGSNLQAVLDAVVLAKNEGRVLYLEEADFLNMSVLRYVCDTAVAHPKFCVIATVNGYLYDGRQKLNEAVLSCLWRYSFNTVSVKDLGYMLRTRFDSVLSDREIHGLLDAYQEVDVFISPREVFHIVEESLWMQFNLTHCWYRRVEMLKKTRVPFVQLGSLGIDSIVKQRDELVEISSMSDLDSNALPRYICVVSGIGAEGVQINGFSTVSFLPYQYFVETNGQIFTACSSSGPLETVARQGCFCLELSIQDPFLWEVFEEGVGLKLPVPTGTEPTSIFLNVDGLDRPLSEMGRVFQDLNGLYYLKFFEKLEGFSLFIKVDFQLAGCLTSQGQYERVVGDNPYQTWEFVLTKELEDLLSHFQMSKREKLRRLEQIFQSMDYDDSVQLKLAYEGADVGQQLVQRFLDLGCGCCFEFNYVFGVIVSKYLGYPIRFVDGLKKIDQPLLYKVHMCVDVFLGNVWQRFDVTPNHRVSENIPPYKSVSSGFQDFVSNIVSLDPLSMCLNSRDVSDNSALICKDIRAWCYATGRIRSTLKSTVFPSSLRSHSLCLDLFYQTSCKLYESVQFQSGDWKPYMKVLLTRFDAPQFRSDVKAYVLALLALEIPVFELRLEGFFQVESYDRINWAVLSDAKPILGRSSFVYMSDLMQALSDHEWYEGDQMDDAFFDSFMHEKKRLSLVIDRKMEGVEACVEKCQKLLPSQVLRQSFVNVMMMAGFSFGDEKKLSVLIDFFKPMFLNLVDCVLPMFSSDIRDIRLVGGYNSSQILNYLRSCPGLKKIENLVLEFVLGREDIEKILRVLPLTATSLCVKEVDWSGWGTEAFLYVPSSLDVLFLNREENFLDVCEEFLANMSHRFPCLRIVFYQ